MAQNGVDFHLPDEILAVIPTDPYDQLDLARKITSMAIASRVSRLESECARLRRSIADRDSAIAELRDRVAHLDRLVHESDARLGAALEENAKLVKERDMLTTTSKKLGRDLAKLETFKKQLMQSLSDDNLMQKSEAADIEAHDHTVARVASWKDGISSSHSVDDLTSGSAVTGESTQDASGPSAYKFSITPYITPRLTPTSTPKFSSTGGHLNNFTAVPVESTILSTHLSPKRPSFSGRPRIDGKEFFRQARTRLSYEQFAAFLANIKELNANNQSREETLEKAEEIFGTENKDLYISFQNLLNRSLS
uniref:At4g15545-like C-terminal domain-containing protein n=1 Tax=Ananas comosus var. bracteatus TaxID=296719 RepID=A0A6V7QYF1_ANACO